MRTKLFLTLFCIALSLTVVGQEDRDSIYTIQTVESEILRGRLLQINKDTIIMRSDILGIVKIARTSIKSMDGEWSRFSKNYTSEPYYVPTGYSSGRGNHYYRNYFLFANDVHFGASDRVDLSFGIEFFSVINGSDALPVVQFGAKYAGEVQENFNIGVATKILANDEGGVALFLVPMTFGGRRTNVTLSPGVAKPLGDEGLFFFPTFNISLGFNKSIRLVTEGVYTDGEAVVTSLIEIDIKQKFALLIGAVFIDDFVIPNLGFSVPFGN